MRLFRRVVFVLSAVVLVVVTAFCAFYASRFQTIASIEKITSYDTGYDLYRMEVRYDYDVDNVIAYGIRSDQDFTDAALREALPLLPAHMRASDYACSAFGTVSSDGDVLMGRNYDFHRNTSAMLIHTAPADGYESVGIVALDDLSANKATASAKSKLACLAAPFCCLDGMNEKGVSIAVLTLEKDATRQNTGKQTITTCLAVRLVLDRVASTAEAVALLQGYDMFASSGRDYHFYIDDATGDGRIVEYDPDSADRQLVAMPVFAATNFYNLDIDRVRAGQDTELYGVGIARYDRIENILSENAGSITDDVAWEAIRSVAQAPREDDVTSNTQWSVLYDDTALTADIVIRRDWGTMTHYDLSRDVVGP